MSTLVFYDGSGPEAERRTGSGPYGQAWAGGRRLVACWKRGRLVAHILDVASLETFKVPLAIFDARSTPVEDKVRVRLAMVAKAIRNRCKILDSFARDKRRDGGLGAKVAKLPRRAIKATLAELKG